MKWLRSKAPLLIVGLSLVAVWQLLATGTDSIAFPDVWATVSRGPAALGELLKLHLGATLLRTSCAYLVGTLLGLCLGAVMYGLPALGRALGTWVDLFRSIPGTIMFPFFLGYLGIKGVRGEVALTMPSLWVVFWITVFSTHRELVAAAGQRRRYLLRHGASWSFVLLHLHAYAVGKSVFGNARVCVSLSLAVLVAMEMLAGSNSGLGYYAKLEQEVNHYEEMVVAIALAGFVGLLLNYGLQRLEDRAIWW